MPSRVIRGEINASRSLSRVSREADLTFRALLVAVDDYGRMDADPLMLKAALYPRRPEVTPETVRAEVEELAAEGCVRLYRVGGAEYLQLVSWEHHRAKGRRAQSSRFPEPPEDAQESEDPRGDPRKSEEVLGNQPPGRWTLDVGRGTGDDANAPPGASEAKPPGSDARGSPETEAPDRYPGSWSDLRAWADEQVAKGKLGDWAADPDALATEWEACRDWHRGLPRRDKRRRRSDWSATFRNWLRKAEEFRGDKRLRAVGGRSPILDFVEGG